MIWGNFVLASVVFFGWLLADSLCSLFGTTLEGVYYPGASGWLRSVPHDWTAKPRVAAPIYLLVFGGLWYWFATRRALRRGLRVAALISAFVMVPFWVVSAVSADLQDVAVNRGWLYSLAYVNASFFLYGFLGSGSLDDLSF